VLLQQVTEAELRALRAQINPHFLFNSLNTVADLIVRDPVRAETMTLRLASVFRHVLAHSSRPLTTVRDEIEFLRAYLYIEEARFGDRLRVEIAVDEAAAGEAVPSLILQPLVENALKHGLGPKPGPGHLSIAVTAEGELLAAASGRRRHGPGRAARVARGGARQRGGTAGDAVPGSGQRHAGSARRRRVPRDGADSARPGGDGMKCLIVDDEEPARARMRRLLAAFPDLEIAGEARDGLEALRKIEELRPDCCSWISNCRDSPVSRCCIRCRAMSRRRW
jgi:CheY-like chemotaxis protein